MTISIDYSVLTSYYLSREGIAPDSASSGAAGATSTTSAASTTASVTPPWDATGASASASKLATAVLNGQNIINPNAAQTNVKGASAEYKSLFTLYQGLNALAGLTQQMQAKDATAENNAKLATTFGKGLQQVSSYVNGLTLPKLRLTTGAVSSLASTTVAPPVENDTYTTSTIFIGAQNDAVPAFQGQVQFNVNVTKYNKQQVSVPIDLNQMGSTPRTMPNVTNFINSQLQAAGLVTRFADADTPGTPQTIQVNGKPVTLPTGPDHWAWTINGDSIETASFSAPSTAAAVYVAQTSGNVSGYAAQVAADKAAQAAATTAGTTITASKQAANDPLTAPVQQLLKFQAGQSTTTPPPAAAVMPGAANSVAGEAYSKTLDSDVSSVQATATGSDGSVYVLANVTGATDGQTIQGGQDVALQKYDSAGNLVYTRTLGAAGSASGLSMAVSADGKVAVAGSFTGALDPNNPGNGANIADSFVTLYDNQGQEAWTQTGTAISNNQINGVTFGAGDAVYVAGQSNFTTDAVTAAGQPKGFVTGYSAAGKTLFTTSTGAVDPTSIAVDGNTLVVAGTSAGDAVVSSYALQTSGPPTLNATRDLGALGGSIAGVAINNGKVVIAGTTTNGALSAGSVTSAAAGGKQAFVAQLSETLASAASDQIAYFGGPAGTSTTATALTVSNGQVYIAGSSNTALPNMPKIGASDGYVASVNLASGTIGWSERFTAQDGHSSPESIAVAQGGASVLDRLGLPQQSIQINDSQLLTAATSVRAGESFQVRTSQGATPVTVTISADDTPATLAVKIERATGFMASVNVAGSGGQNQVHVKAANAHSTVEFLPGPAGRDALESLGLTAGVVQSAPSLSSGSKTSSVSGIALNTYGLNIAGSFDLTTPTGIAAAQKTIQTALAKVQTAYYGLVNANAPKSAKPTITGTVPAYIQAQLANYQAGLSRLQQGSSNTGSASASLAILS